MKAAPLKLNISMQDDLENSHQNFVHYHGLLYTPYQDYTNYAALAAAYPLLTDTTADHAGGLFAR